MNWVLLMMMIILGTVQGPGGSTATKEASLTAVEQWAVSEPGTWPELQSVVETIRAHTARGDTRVLEGLLGIVQNSSQSYRSRGQALELACELADDKAARRAVMILTGIVEQTRNARAGDVAGRALVRPFIDSGARGLLNAMTDHGPLLQLLKEIYCQGYDVWHCWYGFFRLIADCDVSSAVRQEALVHMIVARPSDDIPLFAVNTLEGSAFPPLRRCVREERSPEKFHWTAAKVLADLGDTEMIPEFEGQRRSVASGHPKWARNLEVMIWKIQIQHPPSKLVDFIASTDVLEARPRSWAVERAAALGMPHHRIRDAILKHDQQAETKAERGGMVELKRVALDLGILEETDLPHVKISRSSEAAP